MPSKCMPALCAYLPRITARAHSPPCHALEMHACTLRHFLRITARAHSPPCLRAWHAFQSYPNPMLRASKHFQHGSAAPGRGAQPPRAAAGRAPRQPGPRRRCPAARVRRHPPGSRPRGTATAPGRSPTPRRAAAGRRARRSTRPGTRARWARLRWHRIRVGQGRAVRRLCAVRRPCAARRLARLRRATLPFSTGPEIYQCTGLRTVPRCLTLVLYAEHTHAQRPLSCWQPAAHWGACHHSTVAPAASRAARGTALPPERPGVRGHLAGGAVGTAAPRAWRQRVRQRRQPRRAARQVVGHGAVRQVRQRVAQRGQLPV